METQREELTILQRARMSENDFPVLLYIYNADGFHSGRRVIRHREEAREAFDGPIRLAMREKREVRITDPGDMLVFHAKEGQILWPSRAEVEQAFGFATPVTTEMVSANYARVICRTHGAVFLTEAQYTAETESPDSRWACPECGADCRFDDEYFEAQHMSEADIEV